MKHAAEMSSCAMRDIYTMFHKDCLRHSKVNRENSQIHRHHGDRISLLLLFQNKENRLKMKEAYKVTLLSVCLSVCVSVTSVTV
jgi:hypothetical protein